MNIVLIAFSQDQQIKTAEKYQFTSKCLVTNDIYEQQKQLWQFDKAVIILDKLSFNLSAEYKFEHLTNNLEPNFSIFRTLKLLGYQQVLVSLEQIKLQKYKQAITQLEQSILSIFNDNERISEDERNVFSLKNPELKIVQNCESDEIQKFFHNEINLTQKLIFSTECIVVRHDEEFHVLKVLQGSLYVGQLLKSTQTMSWIKQINVSTTGEISVKFEDNKKLEGVLCSYQHCPDEIIKLEVEIQLAEIPILPLRDVFRKMGQVKMIFGNQEFEIQNTNKNSIEFLGIKTKNGNLIENSKHIDFRQCQLSLQIINQASLKFLNLTSKPILFFINSYQTIVFYGQISKIIEKKNKKVDLNQYFPIQKFKFTQNMIFRQNEDLRYFCRICKAKKINRVLKECGHLRYCNDCVDFCLESKECYYCTKSLTKTYPISVIYLDEKIFIDLQDGKKQFQQFTSKQIIEENQISSYLKLIYKQQKDGFLDFQTIYCNLCDYSMNKNFNCCSNNHIILTCEKCIPTVCLECQDQISFSYKIDYEFLEDLH
ncbi:unnamed protein product [Paramecium sonneborni]|uniref:RING-type domain-containing protein n=1 Tax=Paramecium sonneborni TaxID=65129 RepID=A0A8S1MB53_9CILI|nr:unnamed protein product [Paramecium sonneborni]